MQVCKTPTEKSARAFIAKQLASNPTVGTAIHTRKNNKTDTSMEVKLALSTERSCESADFESTSGKNNEDCVTNYDDKQVPQQ